VVREEVGGGWFFKEDIQHTMGFLIGQKNDYCPF